MENEEHKENEENKESLNQDNSSVVKKSSTMDKFRENPWIVSTIVLGVLAIILIAGNFTGGLTGNVISSTAAGEQLLSFYEASGADGLEINSVDEVSGLYRVNFDYQETVIPIYVTKDGKFAGSLSAISASTSSEDSGVNVPKTDRPKVELFVWGYCPYGVQAQGPLAEVVSLLGDSADFRTVLYYDGHGEFETQQNKIQECIQEIAPSKYWDYAAGFVDDIYPKCSQDGTVSCDKTESINLMKSLGINSDEVFSCVDSKGEDLLSEASSRASELGVSGSPTLVVNGVKTQPSSRTAEAFKSIICEAYSDAPSECDTALSSDAANTAAGNC